MIHLFSLKFPLLFLSSLWELRPFTSDSFEQHGDLPQTHTPDNKVFS